MTDNPLSKYYRSKEVYVKLPTNYKYFTEKPVLSNAGEIGVMPMSTKDEMLLKIPDSLYNGESLFEVVASIVPDIKDPYELCLPDLDIILLATRIASYGKEMEMQVTCPHCEKTNLYGLDLPTILSKIKMLPEEHVIEINDLKISLKPNSVSTINAKRIAALETKKISREMEKIDPTDMPQLKEKLRKSLEAATGARYAILADAIESIELPDGTVVKELNHIIEWLTNTTSAVIDQIDKEKELMNENGIQKTFGITCSEENCNKTFEAPVEFNPAFFFKTK